eukprot:scaffold22025_cov122-Isochrysis_galbana.AAC.1
MAPRQLRLEPTEVDSAADKGAKRVRVDSTDESSSQARDVSAAKTPSGVAAPSLTITASAVHYDGLEPTIGSPINRPRVVFATNMLNHPYTSASVRTAWD